MNGPHEDSPHYQYEPDSIGWLHRRAREAGQILNSDLVRLIEANPELVADDVVRDFVVRGLKGELKARRGRKAASPYRARNFLILDMYEDLVPRLQARADRRKVKGHRKARADFAPAELACALIADRFGMVPESVRNIVSSLKTRGF